MSIRCTSIGHRISTIGTGYTHFARTVKGPGFDAALVKAWLKECDATHGIDCNMGSRVRPSSTKLRLIDIEQQCIVPAPPTCRYTALSYVSGEHVQQADAHHG
jgi:hypothetical protein